jgi:hypothetical protein
MAMCDSMALGSLGQLSHSILWNNHGCYTSLLHFILMKGLDMMAILQFLTTLFVTQYFASDDSGPTTR